jgi:hypothetical protein
MHMHEKCRHMLLPALTEPLTWMMCSRGRAQQVPVFQSSVDLTVLIEVNSWLPTPVQQRQLIAGGARLG